MPLTPEQEEKVLRLAPTMNIIMLAKEIGCNYYTMYEHVNKHTIPTASVRKDHRDGAGKKRFRNQPIKEGDFNVNERENWLI